MEFTVTLKKNYEFRRLYSKGKSTATACLALYCRKNGSVRNRIGYTVSNKIGHAVVRNRIRRRLREIYRLNEAQFQPGWDIVVVARTRAVEAPFEKLTASYLALAAKAGVLLPGGAGK